MTKFWLTISFLCLQTLCSTFAHALTPIIPVAPRENRDIKMAVSDFNALVAKLFERHGFTKKFEKLTYKANLDYSTSRYQVEYIFNPAENELSLMNVCLVVSIIDSGASISLDELEFKKFTFENNEDRRVAVNAIFDAKASSIRNGIKDLFPLKK